MFYIDANTMPHQYGLQLAHFGAEAQIASFRAKLEARLAEEHAEFIKRNRDRNPFKNFELYAVPLIVAVLAYVLRLVSDYTCAPWSDVCRRGSQALGFIYSMITLVLIGMLFHTGRGAVEQARQLYGLVAAPGSVLHNVASGSANGSASASRPHAD
jgi:hypothetical protein